MHVIIDNGHGVDTKGKRSPDNQLREYAWARDVAKKLKCKLEAAGVKCTMLVPEEEDISLKKDVQELMLLLRNTELLIVYL